MLGLQIWICTVSRVARQFLSSTCDVIRSAHPVQLRKFYFPRKHPVLTARLLFDLKFWRRFVQASPQLSFDFVLGVLPRNECLLFSDASSLFGMAGAMVFGYNNAPVNLEGLFWQMTWHDWYKVRPLECLRPGSVQINKGEFLAALITFETFAAHCSGKLTNLALDNRVAKS